MKCFNHRDVEAVAVCVHCGMALCGTCAVRSKNGTLVCSEPCGTASKQLEDFISRIGNVNDRTLLSVAYSYFGLAAICAPMGIGLYFYLHTWLLTIFIEVIALGLAVAGIGYIRIAKRDSD